MILELPFAQPPAPVLELLTPSVVVARRDDQGTVEPLIFLAPGQARFL